MLFGIIIVLVAVAVAILLNKAKLTKLVNQVEEAVAPAIEEVKEVVEKHGEADEQGNVSIPMYVNIVTDEEGQTVSREINPKFVEFQSEFNAVLNEDKELEHKGFTLEEFENVESEGKYDTFFKLIKVGE